MCYFALLIIVWFCHKCYLSSKHEVQPVLNVLPDIVSILGGIPIVISGGHLYNDKADVCQSGMVEMFGIMFVFLVYGAINIILRWALTLIFMFFCWPCLQYCIYKDN